MIKAEKAYKVTTLLSLTLCYCGGTSTLQTRTMAATSLVVYLPSERQAVRTVAHKR